MAHVVYIRVNKENGLTRRTPPQKLFRGVRCIFSCANKVYGSCRITNLTSLGVLTSTCSYRLFRANDRGLRELHIFFESYLPELYVKNVTSYARYADEVATIAIYWTKIFDSELLNYELRFFLIFLFEQWAPNCIYCILRDMSVPVCLIWCANPTVPNAKFENLRMMY